MAAALLATLLVFSSVPVGASTQPDAASTRPDAPSDLRSISALGHVLNAQNQVVSQTESYVQWNHPTNRDSITCYYVRWRVAAKGNRPAGAWQPSEQGAVASRWAEYYDIYGLTIGETYDFEVRSYSESQGAYSDWVTLNDTLTVASNDSSLRSLTLSAAALAPLGRVDDLEGLLGQSLTLTPAFEPELWSGVTYTASVDNSVTSVTFTPTANDDNATITFNGAEVASGTASAAISLVPGPNYLQIKVAAEHGGYWRTYNLNVIRAGPAGSLAAGPAGSLAAPTGLTLTQDAADLKHRVTLSWTPPAGATEAVIEYGKLSSDQSAPTWSSVDVIDLTTSGGKIFTRLRENDDYVVRVAGKNSSGTGAWATATFTAASAPYWPLNVAAASGDASLAVSWDPPSPSDKGYPGAVISGYNVRWRALPDNPCCTWDDTGQDVGDVGSYTITGLTNDQVYEVQVLARNALGAGNWSETVLATPAGEDITEEDERLPGPIGITVEAGTTEAGTMEEDERLPGPIGITVEADEEEAEEDITEEDITEEDITEEDITEEDERLPGPIGITVEAGTTESDPTEKPGTVQDVQSAVKGSKVTVTWTAPQQGGEPGTYVVRLKAAKKGKAKTKRVDADATSVTFGKVKAGTHTVYVRAKNAAGNGKWTKTTVTVPPLVADARPMGVAIRIEVPWERANVSHEWRIELLDEDGDPLMLGESPLVLQGNFEASRPVGLPPGTPLYVPLEINFPTIPVTLGKSYTWQLSINGATHSDWRQSFFVRRSKHSDWHHQSFSVRLPNPNAA